MNEITCVGSQQAPLYEVRTGRDADDDVIELALNILQGRMRQRGVKLSDPTVVTNYLKLQLAELEHEEFYVLLLDTQNHLTHIEPLFRGTLTECTVYPKEIVKLALKHNAHSVILAHNHPSGCSDPSPADKVITDKVKQALELVAVRLLDHFVIGGSQELQVTSFAATGLL